MLEQSKEYLAAVKSPQRQVNAKFTLNNRVYTGTQLAKLDYDQAIVSGTSYTFGGAYVAGLTAETKVLVEGIQEMMPATAEIGISVNGTMQYKPLGQFFVTDIELDRNTNSTKLKLQDGFCKLNGEYQSRLSYPTTARAVFSEICQRCNISTMPMNIPDTIILETKLEKTSYREAIQYIAQLVGSYAIFNRKGQLEFRNIQKLSYRVNRDNYVMGGFKRKEIQFRLNGIECEISNNQKLIAGTSSGNVAKLNNPWMTQIYLDALFSKVQGFQFYPYSLNFQGDPCLDVGDWIEVEYAKGEYFQAPILVQKISFDGGLSSEISANTLGVSDVVYQYKSPLARKVEFIEGRLSADGLSQVYSGLDEPNHEHLKKGDTWFKPNGTDVEIWMYNGEKWEEVASPEVFRQLQADFEALDKQAKEAFEQVDTLVQESPETKRLAQEAQKAVNLANQEITKLQTNVNDTKTALQNAEQEFADSLATTTRELTAKISGIDVGGRNLARNTHGDYTEEETRIIQGDLNYCVFNTKVYTNGLKKGDTVSYRCILRYTDIVVENVKYNTDKARLWVQGEGNVTGWTSGSTFDTRQTDEKAFQISGNGEIELKGQFIVTAEMLKNNYWNTQIRVDYAKSGKIERKCFKVEKGNVYTDWSPAPEDFESDLSNTSIELSTKITESAAKLRTEMSEKYSTKNDLTTLQGEYNSFKEETAKKISQQVSSISTIQTDTTNAKQLANDAYSKANSASQNANNAMASANSAVSTASQAKSNADKAIADVASLTKTVSSQSTRIDQTSSRIEQVASGVTEIGGRIDNLSIGSDNLIVNGGFPIDTSGWAKSANCAFSVGRHQFYFNGNKNLFSVYSIVPDESFVRSDRFKVKRNTNYTISFIGFASRNVRSIDVFFLGRKNGETSDYTINRQPINAWRLSDGSAEFYKATFNTGDSDEGYIRFDHNGSTDGQVASMFFGEVMLVEGNVAKKYQPSSADTQSQIDGINNNIANNYYAKTTVDSKLSTAVSGITAQYTKDISTKLSSYYDKATMDRKLTIGDVGIETYVRNTQTQLNNLSIGADNLIVNGGFPTDTHGWGKEGQGNGRIEVRKHQFYYNESKNLFCIINNTVGKEVTAYSKLFYVKPNTDYTLSFIGFSSSNVVNTEVHYLGRINHGDTSYSVITTLFNNIIMPSGTCQYYQITFNSRNSNEGYIRFDNNGSTDGNECYMFFGEVMLVEGNVAKKYQPSSAEFPTLTQYTQVKQQADQLSATVYDSASGLVTKTTQLAGKYAIQNLNSYGDVLSSLNLNGGNVRIKGGLIDLDGNVRIQDGFVNNLKANSILANEITAKATNIINARIVNLDASYITSGTLSANTISGGKLKSLNNNMEINLDSGDINFYARNLLQGKINNTGQAFYKEGRYLGYIGSADKIQQQSPTPIVLCSENDNFIAFMYKNKYGSYNNSVFIDPLGITGSEGVRFLTDVYFKKIRPLGYGDTVEALACIASYYNNYNYPFFGNSSGNSGLLYGGNWLYFMHDGYVYKFEDVKKLINAFVGLGTIQIPRAIASDGTVDRWTTITI